MIKKILILALCMHLLFSLSLFAGEQERSALKAYSDALSKGNLMQLKSLLSPEFEYHYYKNSKLKKLSRDEELRSIEELFRVARTNRFNEPELFQQEKGNSNKFHIIFSIVFEDLQKYPADSLFRGALLEIDETLTVRVENNKITRIIEAQDKRRKNKLSFGFLKAIRLGNTEGNNVEGGNDLIIYELRDKNSHQLLIIKKILDVRHEYIEESYYWPNNQKIENLN